MSALFQPVILRDEQFCDALMCSDQPETAAQVQSHGAACPAGFKCIVHCFDMHGFKRMRQKQK